MISRNPTTRSKLLDQLRTNLKRRDLINELREASDRYRKDAEKARDPEPVRNSTDHVPLSPAEALKRIKVPEGFHATLFAGDPDVAQPVSMAFDDRGRLWVAECFSYPGAAGPWKSPNRDRILIFEDTTGKGEFDRRTVFTDELRNVTSVLPGFGGVFVCSAPKLIFIPDPKGTDGPLESRWFCSTAGTTPRLDTVWSMG